jgi:hypothetical protein
VIGGGRGVIGGGFGHPLGSMGVAEPPLGAQGNFFFK